MKAITRKREKIETTPKVEFLIIIMMTGLFLSACVSQKKYDLALQKIAELKVQKDFQGYDMADIKYEKNEVIFDQNEELIDKSKRLDSLQERLATQRSNFAKSKAIITALSSSESKAIGAKVEEVEGKVFIPLEDEVLFESSKSTISYDGKKSIEALSKMILSLNYEADVWVVGHTDNEMFDKKDENSNWKLSLDRSLAVTAELIKNGIPSDMLTAAGRGKNAPQSPNKSATGKAQNRRTEIIIVPTVSILSSIYSSK